MGKLPDVGFFKWVFADPTKCAFSLFQVSKSDIFKHFKIFIFHLPGHLCDPLHLPYPGELILGQCIKRCFQKVCPPSAGHGDGELPGARVRGGPGLPQGAAALGQE